MTLSSQLEALRRQRSSDSTPGGSTPKPESGEFSFLRRKLAQFRSGKWRRSADGSSMVRSQSWNHGLQSTSKLQSEWSNSLTSLRENEVVEVVGRGTRTEDRDQDRKPLTRSQSVCHKVPPPQILKFRSSQIEINPRERPLSFAGETSSCSLRQFYRSMEYDSYYRSSNTTKPIAVSCDSLVDRHDEELDASPLGFTRHIGFRRSLHCVPSASGSTSGVQTKTFRRLSNQEEGRSRSLTHMDALEPGAVFKDECEPSRLIVPPLQARRQKLARSQVSSSEYFSVSFEVGANVDGDEFVVASKGTSLAEALNSVCEKRGIELSNVNVYLDSYKTPLPVLTTETSWLGGKHILIKAKDDRPQPTSQRPKTKVSQVSHSRKSSGYRARSGRFFSASTEESADSPDPAAKTNKTSKQRWSGLFGNTKDTKMEALVDHLNNYSKHGIPQLPNADEDLEEALYNLEEDWRDIVDNAAGLPERVQQQQTALWELVHTEVAYIHTLKVVTDLFLSCLTNLQAANILTDVDKTRLFSNITEIYSSNRHFWSHHLLPMLSASRESRQVLNPQLMLNGFLHFEDIFRPYTKYCAEQSQCQQYCREKHNESELFTAYLVWCETQKDCNRLRLMDILVKPMQRITKYSLLLKAIQKHTEADELRLSLDQMIRGVDQFVNSVNTTLRQKQDLEKLRAVIARIEAYDVVESKDEDLERLVRSYNDLDLTCPMPGCCNSQRRQLLLEGDLKIKDNQSSKDVHCFLFTDLMLVCKATTRRSEGRFRVLRQPYLVERLVVQELPRDPATLAVVYLSEYRVPCGAFLLSSSDTKMLKNWASQIKKAQDLYARAKQATTATHSILALSRQPSSFYEEEGSWQEEVAEKDVDSHSVASLGLFPVRSPRGSTRGSSLNHSHSGSVEMENSSISAGSVSQSRGVSVENEVRGSSQSSDEGVPVVTERGYHSSSPRDRYARKIRKCTSPNTLSIQVPVFSCLGQSLPDLNQVTASTSSGTTLLVPPRGTPLRGTSYPPPSPPLRRAPALTLSRNPPLLKTRHIASTGSTVLSSAPSCEMDIPVIQAGDVDVDGEGGEGSSGQQRQAMAKRLARTDKRYHTAGVIEEIKRQDARDSSIHKRLSWNCGGASNDAAHLHRPIVSTPGLSTDSIRSSSGVSSTGESVGSGLNVADNDASMRELRDMYHETFCTTPPASPMSEQLTPGASSLSSSRSQLAEIILNDPSLESSDV